MNRLLLTGLFAAALLLPTGAWARPTVAVYGGTDGVNATRHIADELSATGAFNSVTILDGSESRATLSAYGSILFYTNVGGDMSFANKMPNYISDGGNLVAATFLWQADAMGGTNSLGALAPLLPFAGYGGNYITQVTMVANSPNDALLEGVGSLSAFYHDRTSLAPGARLVASWSDGLPLVAVSPSGVTGVNLFPNDAYGYVYGDYIRLFTNALGGIQPGALLSAAGGDAVPEPTTLGILAIAGALLARRRLFPGAGV